MIHFSSIGKQYGPQVLFQNASFQILPGSRSGLVGPNGAGKTSIFRLIMGEVMRCGNYDFYLKEREIRREQLLASHRRQQEMLAKEEEFIARFAARASHASQVQSRVKKIAKIERIEIPPEQRTMKFEFSEPPRSGDDVVKLENLGKVWTRPDGTEKSVFGGVSGMIRRGEKINMPWTSWTGKRRCSTRCRRSCPRPI